MRRAFFVLLTCLLLRQGFAQTDSIPAVNRLLQLPLEDLMNLTVVTASGFHQTMAEAPSTIIVITSQQIAERGYEQLEDALRDVPGIDMIHINGYAPTLIYFRGMYGAENLRALLMIDGIVENNLIGSNDMAGPAYNLHNVDRIEIIWGPVSALYGASAFGGIIHLITKKGAELNSFHIEQGFGSFNTTVTNVNFGLQKNKIEFALAGTLYSTDGPVFRNRDPQYSGSYVDRAHSINTNFSYVGKKSKTTVGFRTFRTPMGWGTYSNSPTVYFRLPPQGYSNSGVLGVVQRNFRGERSGMHEPFLSTWFLQNEFRPNDKLRILSRAYYRETGTSPDSYIYLTLDGRRMIRAIVATLSNRKAAEITASFAPLPAHHFTAGLDYYRDDLEKGGRQMNFDLNTIYLVDGRDTLVNLNATFKPRQSDIRRNFGSFLQYQYTSNLLGKTSFTGGLRYDHNNYFGDNLSPRLAIVNSPTAKWNFKFQFGKAFRPPTNIEIYQTPGGNFRIKKERISTYEVNIIYQPVRNWTFQLNGYRNHLKDAVAISNLSGLTINKNPVTFKIWGLEFLANGKFNETVSAYGNLTYQSPHFKNLLSGAEGKVAAVADFKANMGVVFDIAELFTMDISGNYVGERRKQSTNPYGNIPSYFLANLSFRSHELFNKKIITSFVVRNLFNKQWFDPGFRTADGFLYSTLLEQPGLTLLLKVGVTL